MELQVSRSDFLLCPFFIFEFLLLLLTLLTFYAALHISQQDSISLFFQGLLLFISAFLVAVFSETFFLFFWSVILLTIRSLFASLFFLLFTILHLLTTRCTVFLLKWNSLW